jgi:cold shock CspA family protein/ribosome-associated translation inhibitor RaiA
MDTAPQIVFEHMEPSDSLRALVMEELTKLEEFGRIVAARVAISPPPHSHRRNHLYSTKIRLTLPAGHEVAVSHDPDSNRHTEDATTSVRDAFDAARRQVQDRFRVMAGEVKPHAVAENLGTIAQIMRDEGYGFLETDSGHEVFFTRAKVKHNGYDKLDIGMRVYFNEEMGDEGPVATAVRIAAGN